MFNLSKSKSCASKSRREQRHVFRFQSLEPRQLLAGDILVAGDTSTVSAEVATALAPAEFANSGRSDITQVIAEGESTSTVHFRFDYSNDTGFFRDHPERRALLEQAGRYLTDRLSDTLDAIPASTTAAPWFYSYTNPSTGAITRLPTNFAAAANEIVVFVGSRNLQSLDQDAVNKTRAHAEGVKEPASFGPCSTQALCDDLFGRLTTRGETMVVTVNNVRKTVDFAPFAGSISFDTRSETLNAWNFEDGPLQTNQFRFLTFAQHELAHILGHGISQSFIEQAQTGRFTGPETDKVYVGSGNVPLNGGHIAQSVASEQSTIMTASIVNGDLFSPLDFAVLDDIGWQLVPDTRPTVTLTTADRVVAENVGSFEITASLSAASTSAITLPLTLTGVASSTSDVTLSSPQFSFAANQRTATITVNVVNDSVNETTEAVTMAIQDNASVKLGTNIDVRITMLDDDGVQLEKVPRIDPATVTNSLAIPGDNQARAIVFRAGSNQTLSVNAQNTDQISEAVLLFDDSRQIIGTYGATGLTSAPLTKGESYALVFYPRLTARTFAISLPGGFEAVPARRNVLFPQDVNGDGIVTEVDALQIINQLNLIINGNTSIDAPTVTGESFYDVNGDGLLTAVDALQVINYLNSLSPSSEPLSDRRDIDVPVITADANATNLLGSSEVDSRIAVEAMPLTSKVVDASPASPKIGAFCAIETISASAIDRVLENESEFDDFLQLLS